MEFHNLIFIIHEALKDLELQCAALQTVLDSTSVACFKLSPEQLLEPFIYLDCYIGDIVGTLLLSIVNFMQYFIA